MNNPITEDMLIAVSLKAEQLGTIAWLAGCTDLVPEKREQVFKDVLFGINNLSKQIVNDLDELANIASGVHAV